MDLHRSSSLKRQMIAYFSIVFSLIFAIFGWVILRYNSNGLRERSYEYCRQIVGARIMLIDTYFLQLQNVSRVIASDVDVEEAVAFRNATTTINYADELYRQRVVINKIKQADVLGNLDTTMIIGGDNQYLYFYGQSPRKGYDFGRAQWFRDAIAAKDLTPRFTGMHDTDYLLGGEDRYTVSLITPIINTAQFDAGDPAYLVCDFRLEPILAAQNAPEDIRIAIFDGEAPVRFEEVSLSAAQRDELMNNLQGGASSFMLPRDLQSIAPYIVVRAQSQVSGWTILGIMPVADIETYRNANTVFVALLVLLSIGIIVVLSLLISNSILIPLRQLLTRFDAIASGATEVNFAVTRSVEINLLSDTAHHMLRNIEKLRNESLAQQALLTNEQFKVLQHQINPHFVNNTLQTIKALALNNDTAAISRITTLLGRILSYSVYNPLDRVPLFEELNYIENYIELQRARYPGITYGIECSAEAGAVRVPKLIVQPIVENAIEHGLADNKAGRIDLFIEEDEDELHILVIDSGVGFSEDRLEAVRASLEASDAKKEGDHIGIMNVHRRIRKIYGERYGVSILSRTGMRTSVVISVARGGE